MERGAGGGRPYTSSRSSGAPRWSTTPWTPTSSASSSSTTTSRRSKTSASTC